MDHALTVTRGRVAEADAETFTTLFPVPGLGLVPIQAFLLRAAEPVLVDTGFLAMGGVYAHAIEAAIDLGDIRWIWLTHVDADHIGSLFDLLERAPRATLVTTFLGLGKLGTVGEISPRRAYLLNPGQSLDVGDRTLVAVKPPVFDAPETTGFFDGKTRTLFSSDCFGTILSAPVERANDLRRAALHEGVSTWATIDAPWMAMVEPAAHERGLARIRNLAPRVVLSSHAPPAIGMADVLLDELSKARTAPPFIGPDQEALTRMLGAA